MKSKVNKTVFLILLIVVAAALSVSTLSYWAEAVANNATGAQNSNNITIGAGGQVQTSLVLNTGAVGEKVLVPTGKAVVSANPENSVEFKDIEYSIKWKSDNINAAQGTKGALSAQVNTNDIKIGGDGTYKGLIVTEIVDFDPDIYADGDEVKVTVRVTLTEPDSKAVYDAIINKEFLIPVTFTVTPQA